MLYLEDFTPGRTFTADPATIDGTAVVEFARSFDPQPFHTEPDAAASLFFGGLVASGWHTAAICMRMAVESELGTIANGLVGLEVSQLRWPVPSRPGDTLQLSIEVIAARPSISRPRWGTVRLRWTACNQRGETALTAENVIWVARRD